MSKSDVDALFCEMGICCCERHEGQLNPVTECTDFVSKYGTLHALKSGVQAFTCTDREIVARDITIALRRVVGKVKVQATKTVWDSGTIPFHHYPIKRHVGAARKVNITAAEAIMGVYKHCKAAYCALVRLSPLFEGMYDDQVAAITLYTVAVGNLPGVGYDLAGRLALIAVTCTDFVDALSTKIKQYGLAAGMAYAVELKVLLGRGVAEIDCVAAARQRLRLPDLDMVTVADSDLYAAIEAVIADELEDVVEHENLDEFWTSRWLWSANGSHSRALEHAHPELATRKEGQAYRKAVMEQWSCNPMLSWDGNVFVTPSQKLEHGKSRLLLACDTLSYMWFEYLLAPFEKVWLNKSAVINPGLLGTRGVHDKLLAWAREDDRSFFALDFDDFNSQHTLRAQAMVVDALLKRSVIAPAHKDMLSNSFHKMQLWANRKFQGMIAGTLMSGHRATTFLNTVLNAAYIRLAGVRHGPSLHVGDDVIMRATVPEVDALILQLRRYNIRVNSSKQVICRDVGEFLRVSHTRQAAYGYVARAVASAVSGNWVSDHVLDKREALTNAITCVRSIINRTYCERESAIARVVARSVARRSALADEAAYRLLSGRDCLEGGAVYGKKPNSCDVWHCREYRPEQAAFEAAKYGCHASTDYLTYHVKQIELDAILAVGADILPMMVHSSWKKVIEAEDPPEKSDIAFYPVPFHFGRYEVHDTDVLMQEEKVGVLTRYPLVMMLAERLSLKEALELAHRNGIAAETYEDLFGNRSSVVGVTGIMPYNDACALSKRLNRPGAVIITDVNLFV